MHRYLRAAWATAFCLLAGASAAATLTVTTTSDTINGADGCSLREAITAINNAANFSDCAGTAYGSSDTINFAIAGAGVHVIQPTSQLPFIHQTVLIDGYSQSGASVNTLSGTTYPGAQAINAVLRIEIDGASAGNSGGLVLWTDAPNSVIRGLSVVNFAQWQQRYGERQCRRRLRVERYRPARHAKLNGKRQRDRHRRRRRHAGQCAVRYRGDQQSRPGAIARHRHQRQRHRAQRHRRHRR